MPISILKLLSNFQKSHSRQTPGHSHLMLNGINQKVFLNQWGEPETQIGLNQIGKFNKLGTMFLITDPAEESNLSVWIYRKKDRILLFTKQKLISHFSFKRFR